MAVNASHRWRLVLGKYAQSRLQPAMGSGFTDTNRRMDLALDYLYGREYQGRGLRKEHSAGSLSPSQLTLTKWLSEIRELFPKETIENIEKHALGRYGMSELLTDPTVLEKLEPNQQLLHTLLTLKGHLKGDVVHMARRIIRQVVEEIRRQLEVEVRQLLSGRLNRFSHSPLKISQNFDAAGTLRKNLKHFNVERQQLVVEDILFFARNNRRLPWEIILCVDQSGSMVDSVIHSAVMAGILAALPAFKVKLILFDTTIVDLSEHVDDPVEVLMSAQLGGGTYIAQAVRYGSQLIENPHRTVFVLISDFCEGAPPSELISAVTKLAEDRVKLLGLASLDDQSHPVFDRHMAERLAACGMEIAALTPQKLAQWLVKVIS